MHVEAVLVPEQREQVVRVVRGDRDEARILRELAGEDRRDRDLGVRRDRPVVAVPRRALRERGEVREQRRVDLAAAVEQRLLGELVHHDHDEPRRLADRRSAGTGAPGVEDDGDGFREEEQHRERDRRDREEAQPQPDDVEAQDQVRPHDAEHDAADHEDGRAQVGLLLQDLDADGGDDDAEEPEMDPAAGRRHDQADDHLPGPEQRRGDDDEPDGQDDELGARRPLGHEDGRVLAQDRQGGLGERDAGQREELEERPDLAPPRTEAGRRRGRGRLGGPGGPGRRGGCGARIRLVLALGRHAAGHPPHPLGAPVSRGQGG